MQAAMTSHATHSRAWRFFLAAIVPVIALSSCVTVPLSTRVQMNRAFGDAGEIHATRSNRFGPAIMLETATYVSGAKPYDPSNLKTLACSDPDIAVDVYWSPADGVSESDAQNACTWTTAAVNHDSMMVGKQPPSITYFIQLVPRGHSYYRRSVSIGLFGPPHLLYAVHADSTMAISISDSIAHETLHAWAELFKVPQARREGTREEQVAYLAGECATLAITGRFDIRDKATLTSDASAASYVTRSAQGDINIGEKIKPFFAEGPILQLDSAEGRRFQDFCKAKISAFFAP